MPDLVLTEREQSCVRALMALEPAPGGLPPAHVLTLISRLVPSDTIDIHVADATGFVIDLVSLPPEALVSIDPQVCDGPLPLGIVHQSRDPDHQDLLGHVGVADGVVVGFRNGKDHVAQLSLDRFRRTFTDRDLAMLRMISPALQRLMRTHQTCALPTSLTVTERRVLQLVATGRSNSAGRAQPHGRRGRLRRASSRRSGSSTTSATGARSRRSREQARTATPTPLRRPGGPHWSPTRRTPTTPVVTRPPRDRGWRWSAGRWVTTPT